MPGEKPVKRLQGLIQEVLKGDFSTKAKDPEWKEFFLLRSQNRDLNQIFVNYARSQNASDNDIQNFLEQSPAGIGDRVYRELGLLRKFMIELKKESLKEVTEDDLADTLIEILPNDPELLRKIVENINLLIDLYDTYGSDPANVSLSTLRTAAMNKQGLSDISFFEVDETEINDFFTTIQELNIRLPEQYRKVLFEIPETDNIMHKLETLNKNIGMMQGVVHDDKFKNELPDIAKNIKKRLDKIEDQIGKWEHYINQKEKQKKIKFLYRPVAKQFLATPDRGVEPPKDMRKIYHDFKKYYKKMMHNLKDLNRYFKDYKTSLEKEIITQAKFSGLINKKTTFDQFEEIYQDLKSESLRNPRLIDLLDKYKAMEEQLDKLTNESIGERIKSYEDFIKKIKIPPKNTWKKLFSRSTPEEILIERASKIFKEQARYDEKQKKKIVPVVPKTRPRKSVS